MRKVKRGQPILDATKGSAEYTIYEIDRAFRAQFGLRSWDYCICDTFTDHLIVRDFALPMDEYWLVTYTQDAAGYTFAAQADWERVQLAYAPAKNPAPIAPPSPDAMAMGMGDARIPQRLISERVGTVQLLDSTTDAGERRVRGVGLTAGQINENRRRYPLAVVADAVKRAQAQQANQPGKLGRGPLLGEAEHPSDRGESRPLWLNTVFVWDTIALDGARSSWRAG